MEAEEEAMDEEDEAGTSCKQKQKRGVKQRGEPEKHGGGQKDD